MDVFITHESALEFWRLHRRSRKKHVYSPSRKRPSDGSPTSYALRHGEARGLTLPLDIMVSELKARRPSKAVVPHVYSSTLSDSAFVDAGNGLYMSSPEFCFFQMADEYPLGKFIALGLELCGSYSLPGNVSAGLEQVSSADRGASGQLSHSHIAAEQTLYELPPLTNKRKLKAFTARMEGRLGYNQAIKALNYIADDSASPMETILVILLTLPYRDGGYGLPMPELNGRIYPGKGIRKFSGREFYRGDLLWREAGVVAEYNSDLEHASPESIAKDAIRRSDLELCGFYEVTVTKRQIKNVGLFDNVARQAAAKIGKRLRYKDPEFSRARDELRGVLL